LIAGVVLPNSTAIVILSILALNRPAKSWDFQNFVGLCQIDISLFNAYNAQPDSPTFIFELKKKRINYVV